jgi:hypothetical protein
MNIDIDIKKYPYLGYSSNLIELFMIVGYEKTYITSEILTNLNQETKVDNEKNEPTILSQITSDSDINMIDDDTLIKLIYPKSPMILTVNTNVAEPQSTSSIFFINADGIDATSKNPFHGCALHFYESYIANNQKVLIPKSFLIVSQFPYFALFNSINREILNSFKKENEIPIEITIYNIINCIPSPVNFGINLNIFQTKELSHYAQHNIRHHNSCTSNTPNIQRTFNSGPYSIMQLNGYPVLDFNISEIFNIIPMNMVVEILIFNFLEFEMLFFSKNLEILNLTMYVISCLNYPCTDSLYLWHILSVSLEEFLSIDACKFAAKPWASMLGIHTSYINNIDTCSVKESHFVVDLDNKSFFFKTNKNTEDSQKANTLLNYIRRITGDYNVTSTFLHKNIRGLLRELDIIVRQVVANNNDRSFLNYSTNFYECNDRVKILNKNIQEAFYDFILNILIVFYNNYYLNNDFEGENNSNFSIHYHENIQSFASQEVIFYEFFKNSNKYNNYVLNFIQEFKCIGLYKIPLIFSEEFIYLKKNNNDNLFRSRFFEIIENFYSDNNINNKKMIHFHSFYQYYENSLKNYIYQEVLDSNKKSINSRLNAVIKDHNKPTFIYDAVELDSNILFKYMYHLRNISDIEKCDIFPYKINGENNFKIKSVKFGEIVDSIERNLISHNIIKSDHLIVFSVILTFVMTRSVCNFSESISHLRDILELIDSKNFLLRKYMNMILATYNVNHKDTKLFTDTHPHCINSSSVCSYISNMCNFIVINFMRTKNILPNELMMNHFHNFKFNSEKGDSNQDNLMDEDPKEKELENFKLFLSHHFCKHGKRGPEYFLSLANDNSSYEGDLYIECCPSLESRTKITFKFDFSDKFIDSEIFSPLKLYNLTYSLYIEYSKHLQFKLLDRKILDKVLINLMFYCKNSGYTYKFLLKFLDY